ncbi:hypothetical protein G8759_10280 [Spirosoma aureum]|uniref:Uncharacterized protein n=1 Tax=Spirosoma aureum TaxID=2692134 RepID=A0A6G9AKX0_9BACT|nr:hypothetical protein [Spirosoma aureum]QIP12984.1 hypothetical protein G8759_10280 [Spirosoma aureum]
MLNKIITTKGLQFILLFMLLNSLISCKKEAEPTKTCIKPAGLSSVVDASDLNKYIFSLSGEVADISDQITWSITDGSNKKINSTTLLKSQSFSYNFSNDGNYKITAEALTSCNDKILLETSINVSIVIPVASGFSITEKMVYKNIGAVAITNNGIVISQELDKIKVWDYSNKALLKTLDGGSFTNQILRLSVDEKDLFSTSNNKIFIWDWKNGILKKTLSAHTGYIYSINVSADNKYLVSCADLTIRLWSISTGELIKTINTVETPYSVSMTKDQKYIVAGFSKYFILYDAATGKEIWKQTDSETPLFNLFIDLNGERIFANSYDYSSNKYSVNIWNIASKRIEKKLDLGYGYNISYDGRYYITNLGVIDAKNLAVLWSQPSQEIGIAAISSDGKFLAKAHSMNDNIISLYNPATGEAYNIPTERHIHLVKAGAISINSKLMATVDQSIFKIWNTINGQQLMPSLSNNNYIKVVNINNNILTTLGQNPCPEVTRWDINQGTNTPILKQSLGSNSTSICDTSSILSSDGNFVFYNKDGDYNETSIWDINSGKNIFSFKGRYLGMSNDNQKVYSFDYNTGNIKLLELATGKELKNIYFSNKDFIYYSSVSKDGSYLAASSNINTLTIFNLNTGAIVSKLPFSNMKDITRIEFSNDGKKIAFGDLNNILIKDVASGTTIKDGQFNDSITSIKFHPSGKALYVITERDFSVINF